MDVREGGEKILLVLLVMAVFSGLVEAGSYIVAAPSMLRPGDNYNVSIALFNVASETVTIRASLRQGLAEGSAPLWDAIISSEPTSKTTSIQRDGQTASITFKANTSFKPKNLLSTCNFHRRQCEDQQFYECATSFSQDPLSANPD
ncbi:hypothetical protein ACJMK2_009153 [Sinanodonta woodiana]|uniref:Uncharacterized protein n=1 Tax=Sinanodonta woodiana TaxID=1069815 RepID=A0ABD3VBE1_SINWO